MADDKVHPDAEDATPQPKLPSQDPPVSPPPALTYVIQVPKDQIYRVPPPENAKLQEKYARRGRSLRRRHPCFCYLVLPLVVLTLLVAAAAGVLYFVFQPRYPTISVESASFSGLENITSSTSPPASPSVGLTVTLRNDNRKIGVYYTGGDVVLSYEGVELGRGGAWPVTYQPRGTYRAVNVTVKGTSVVLSKEEKSSLADDMSEGSIPMVIRVVVDAKFKVGLVRTWRMKLKTRCEVIVDRLNSSAKVVDQECSHRINIFHKF
ncbi:hypothetical protein MLD38_008178 [Melastoma candidum]|uniref:Uncharacterized protein n=1 Tax=Melastoma candidum TaxID=119954 RepID=A0ACB9RVC8_9MYRT|nr:hypothetical protein MLD38_008178 [Melastoma candidum]